MGKIEKDLTNEAVETTASINGEKVEASIDGVETTAVANTEENEDISMVLKFKKPYKFEGKEYTELDLSGLDDLTASDMIATNKYMQRTSGGGIDVMPEVSLEYACVLASKAVKLPIEFFTSLPPREAMRVKNRVMGFLFGAD